MDCVPCVSKTWSVALWKRRKKREDCGAGKEHSGSSLMSMARDKLRANELCPALLTSHQPGAAWMRCVLQGISDASEGKRSEPERLCFRPTPTNGSARFRGHRAQATAIIEENCGRGRSGIRTE